MQIPAGLGALLAKLGLGGQLLEGKLAGEAKASGLTAHGKTGAGEGLEKGAILGPDGELLAGLGYNDADKESPKKNINEKGNVERFLKETGVERAEADNPFRNLGEAGEKLAPQDKEKAAEQKETAERREVAETETRRDERADEARVQGQHDVEAKEAREQAEVTEPEARDQQQEEDEEDKPGAGWVAEELEEEEKARKRGLRDADVMGEIHRCRAHLEDGTGCLRKPVKGTPYCREHAASWRVVRPIDKA